VTGVQWGTTRQVWFAPLADVDDVDVFPIRDDAYTKQGISGGRSFRLGDKVDLGPYSTWRQTSWVGGEQQEIWRDDEMYLNGQLDTFRKNGKVKLHRALGDVDVSEARGDTAITIGRSTTVVDRHTPVTVLCGETTYYTGGSAPSGGYRVLGAKRGVPIATFKTDLDASVMSFSPVNDSYKGSFVGLANGKVWTHVMTGNVWNLEHTFSSGDPVFNIESFSNATYFACGSKVYRRTYDGSATYDLFFSPPGGKLLRGMTVWNNRLWFCSLSYGRTATIYVSDGVYTVPAFSFPGEFEVMGMVVYAGSLYVYGSRPGQDGTSFQGQIWRYTGSNVSLLHKQGTGLDGEDHTIWDAVVHDDVLYWSRTGHASNDYVAGLNAYKAETDAIFTGPIERGTETQTPYSLDIYDQTVAVAIFRDSGSYFLRPASQDEAVTRSTSTVRRSLYSSVYDADLPNEKKTWIRARMRVKIPGEDTAAELRLVVDENGTEILVGRAEYDGNDEYRVVSFDLEASAGVPLQSTSIQYVLYLENTTAVSGSLLNPEVDAIEVDFAPAPTKRRQWRIRCIAADASAMLDGNPNALTTAIAMEQKLESYWQTNAPVYFWDAAASGGSTPSGSPVKVILDDYMVQSYRVDTADNEVISEVTLSFYEAPA
jgi:hypothetical protein